MFFEKKIVSTICIAYRLRIEIKSVCLNRVVLDSLLALPCERHIQPGRKWQAIERLAFLAL